MEVLELESIKAEICDKYCKYPEIYSCKDNDKTHDRYEEMLEEKCISCPLSRLEIDDLETEERKNG